MKYAVALERAREVARDQRWGRGSSLYYQSELADDFRHYARSKSGLEHIPGFQTFIQGCLYSLGGALTGAAFGAIFMGNGDETGLVTKTFYKLGGGIGGFFSGWALIDIPYFTFWNIRGKTIEHIIHERTKRVKERGRKISLAQRKSAWRGLIRSESDRINKLYL